MNMEYADLPGVEKPVSRFVLGAMIVNTNAMEESTRLLDHAVDLGYTTLDTAHVYGGGNSERAIGQWMAERGNRDQLVILSKGAHHNADRRRVTPFDIAEANEYAEAHGLVPFTASSPNFSLAAQLEDPWGGGSVTLSGPENAEARAWYRENGMPVFAWSSLARGLLSGRVSRENFDHVKENLDDACRRAYCHEENFRRLDRVQTLAEERGLSVPQVALAWVLNQPLNVFPIIGAASRAELEAHLAAAQLELRPRELAWLNLERDLR